MDFVGALTLTEPPVRAILRCEACENAVLRKVKVHNKSTSLLVKFFASQARIAKLQVLDVFVSLNACKKSL